MRIQPAEQLKPEPMHARQPSIYPILDVHHIAKKGDKEEAVHILTITAFTAKITSTVKRKFQCRMVKAPCASFGPEGTGTKFAMIGASADTA